MEKEFGFDKEIWRGAIKDLMGEKDFSITSENTTKKLK